jgi:hypothetical protein
VSYKDLVSSLEISFNYPCPDCGEETRGEIYPEDYEGKDVQLSTLIEEISEKLCWRCQQVYDCGGLKNKDFI